MVLAQAFAQLKQLKNKNLLYITVESKDVKKIIKDLKLSETEMEGNTIKFKNGGSIDDLVKSLGKYTINKLLIEEATLEDVFLHYYK